MKELPKRQSTIISLWPKIGFQSNRMNGYYEIEPCPPCEAHQKTPCRDCKRYAALKVGRVFDLEDIGEKKTRKDWIDDRELAMDLAGLVKNHGVLAIEGDTPTAEELDEAFDNLESYFQDVIAWEDRVFQATGKHNNVEHAAMAANYFGLQRPWLADTRPKKPCTVCSTHNPFNAVRCVNQSCGAILDWEAARDAGILTERQEQVGILKGFLKPLEAPPVAVGKGKKGQGVFEQGEQI